MERRNNPTPRWPWEHISPDARDLIEPGHPLQGSVAHDDDDTWFRLRDGVVEIWTTVGYRLLGPEEAVEFILRRTAAQRVVDGEEGPIFTHSREDPIKVKP